LGKRCDKTGDEYAALGKILRAQGNKGELRVLPYSNSAEDLMRLETKEFFLRARGEENFRAVRLESVWLHKGFAIIKIEGCDTIAEAKLLAGSEIFVRLEDRWALPPDEYYVDQIIGMRVLDVVEEEWLGEVTTFVFGSANDLMVVAYKGKELSVPFVRQIVREIDSEKGVVEVELPAGLREICLSEVRSSKGQRRK
jgi:16S rRNA processing protein RimM